MLRRPRRRAASLVLAVLVVAAGCIAPPPVGRFADITYGVERIDDITYGSAVDWHGNRVDLQMDMFRPVGAAGPVPAIVFIHSGAFTGGYRGEQDAVARQFASRGYITVTISYRLRPGAWIWFNTPDLAKAAARDARHDAQAAVRWLRANGGTYGVDGGHIAAAGYSAGGITAIGMAQHSDDPGDSGTPGESSKICVAVSLSGIAVEGQPEPGDSPILMFHGGDDVIVPTSFARETAWAAGTSHVLAGYVEYKKIGHGLFFQKLGEATPTITRVLREYLVEKPACA